MFVIFSINLGDEKTKERYIAQFIRIHSDFGHKPIKVIKNVRNKQEQTTEHSQAYLNNYLNKNNKFITPNKVVVSNESNSLLFKNDQKTFNDLKVKTTNLQSKYFLSNQILNLIVLEIH